MHEPLPEQEPPEPGRLERVRAEIRHARENPSQRTSRASAARRLVAFHVRAAVLRQPTRFPVGERSWIYVDKRFASTLKVLSQDPPDGGHMLAWKRFLNEGSLFLDVGSNAGLYAVWAADLGARVVAVEPEPRARQLLGRNAALNGYAFEIVPAALSQASGSARFTEKEGPNNHLLSAGSDGGSGSGSGSGDGVTVETRTLDDVLGERTAHGTKIDVEGAERLVLEGAGRALSEGRLPVIQVEYNFLSTEYFGESRTALRDLLASYGYRFYRADERGDLVEKPIWGGGGGDVFAILP